MVGHMRVLAAAVAAALPSAAWGAKVVSDAESASNPVRKVVTMLQSMQKKVAAEGEKEKELYEKFMCYCKTSGSDLTGAISTAEAKVPSVSSDIESSEAQKTQLEEALKQAQVDRSECKTAMAEATSIREKEAKAFAAEKSEFTANIDAIRKATAALEKGMSGSLLQTSLAQTLRKVVAGATDLVEDDRQQVLAFLTGGQDSEYAPQSGQITGILKQLGDDMAKSLDEVTSEEEERIASYSELMKAKTKEMNACTKSIEAKTKRIGELGVAIVEMKNDLALTQEALAEDKKFAAELETSCSTKTSEWDERTKTRSAELVAISETITILNDDDALELFKKTLPAPSASFVQVGTMSDLRRKALAALRKARQGAPGGNHARMDLLALALAGKKVDFSKILTMIDEMVATLKTEQTDDDHKKEYCGTQLDQADDKKKSLENDVQDLNTAIESAEAGLATVKDEIKTAEAAIKALDKSVAEATSNRQQESTEYKELMSSNTAAKELLAIAKNRLNKFYNPKLYKPPAKVELSAEDRIVSNMGGAVLTQLSSYARKVAGKDAPAPPPETWDAYGKKGEESTGVIAMIDLLIKDLDKEMTEAETQERESQADYEKLMADSAEERMMGTKNVASKAEAQANLEAQLQGDKGALRSTSKELMATAKYISMLHTECDWLLQYYDTRKEARAGEIDSLNNAKAVLSGASFSFIQTLSSGLRGRP